MPLGSCCQIHFPFSNEDLTIKASWNSMLGEVVSKFDNVTVCGNSVLMYVINNYFLVQCIIQHKYLKTFNMFSNYV